MSDERNERTKDTVRKKVVEYIERAEKIKEHLAKLEEKLKRSALTTSSNGTPLECVAVKGNCMFPGLTATLEDVEPMERDGYENGRLSYRTKSQLRH
ncbi:hypothetical protein BGZ65_010840 [Modicella reniformis]|uniref:Uncharacterized protein n=1 Tax=Modicella reniformis TaxID=1440133 RepID=A0A9P6J474_9FUNG|nr:hypothetical protein BGZ65_010840 [Modicella reniformis]